MRHAAVWPRPTWNLGGELGDDGGAVALGCAGAQGEGVRGARVEASERVGGLVAQLHHLPTLVGEVQLGVKGAHRLVGDLGEQRKKLTFWRWPLACPHVELSSAGTDLYSYNQNTLWWRSFFLTALLSKSEIPLSDSESLVLYFLLSTSYFLYTCTKDWTQFNNPGNVSEKYISYTAL